MNLHPLATWRSALVGASLLSVVTAVAAPKSYIVLSSGTGLPPGLQAKITAAGGTITRTIPQVGIAIATSDKADFATKASTIQGVRSTIPNLALQWLPKETIAEGVSLNDAANPPNSLDNDRFFDLQWGHTAIEAPAAWNAGYRGAGVRVAVLDAGISHTHPDLAPNLNSTLSASFVPGEDWRVRPGFFFNHGTHVAGTIAAADNGIGIIGVAPEAEIVAIKVLSEFTGSGDFDYLISGLVYAGDIGAKVINMSLGAYLPRHGIFDENGNKVATASEISELVVALGRATTYAYQHGAVLIASAGNDHIDADHDKDGIDIPASSPHVIRIAATAPVGWAADFNTTLDNPASYSNYGQSFISLAGPGGDFIYPGEELRQVAGLTRPAWVFDLVFSSIPGGYGWAAGTSMAAPHVSGVAALIIGKAGGAITPSGVEAILRQSAEDLGKPGKDDFYGAGRVNALNAVQ